MSDQHDTTVASASSETDGGSVSGEGSGLADDGGPRIPSSDGGRDRQRSMVEYLQWAVFGLLVIGLAIAAIGFYTSATASINRFVADQYRPLFKTGFNLALLLACALGLSVLVRRMA